MSTILRTIGIDISKDWLDAFAAPEGKAARFSNDSAGFRKLIVWVGSEVDRIAYEPSGAFHRDLEDTLLKAGLPLYAINPFQVRSFARLPGPTRQDRRGGRPDAGLDGGGHRGSAPDRGEIGGAARPRRAPADPRRAAQGEALVAKGKPPKVALTAVMRKLLLLANTLVQQDRIWTAQMPGEYSCPVFPTTACPVGSGHRMIGMRKSRHRKGGVARQVSAPQTRIHLTWILPSRNAMPIVNNSVPGNPCQVNVSGFTAST